MLLKVSLKLYFLLSLFIIFAINSVHAKKSKKPKVNNDQFYIVITKNGSEDGKNKREEKEQFLDALVTEINNLIIGNKDTYDDPSLLEKLEEAPTPETPFTKRSVIEDEEDEEDDEDDDGEEEPEHKFAYVISSLEDESLISTYLSKELVPIVEEMPNVKTVLPDIKLELSSNRNNHLKEIKDTYKWEHPCVKGNTYNHLSLISQDKFDDSNNSTTYDVNYYYPSSAGKDINIFIIDGGFNFNFEEFSNRSTKKEKNDRIATCIAATRYNCLYYDINSICRDTYDDGHGNVVAGVAAGLKYGVASRANIYGVAIQTAWVDDINAYVSSLIHGLEIINTRYLNETIPENVDKFIHKSVINMSNGYFLKEQQGYTLEQVKDLTDYLGRLIKDMSNKGAVIVASAGNQHSDIDVTEFYPCSFNDVICVGATDNIGLNEDYYYVEDLLNNQDQYPDQNKWQKLVDDGKYIFSENYNKFFDNKFVLSKSYRRAYFSNYGTKVDMYAPGYVKARGVNENKENFDGTSFSSPIVAGVAATIMSEKPYKKYTTSEMKKELQEMGLKNILDNVKPNTPNIFVNNGKLLRYDFDNDEEDDEDMAELECYHHGCCLRD